MLFITNVYPPKKKYGLKSKEKSILKFPPSQIVYKNANTNFKFKISINALDTIIKG